MNSNKINAKMLAKMFLAGAKNLEVKKEWINELNVFPVPDGDTGTNMTLTIMSAAKEVINLQDEDMMTICKAISSGSLRGARGNSGVILSQLFRGFTKTIREYEEIDIPTLATATEKAVESAYKAVMKPKEGTILTVAKGMADKARELSEEGCDDMELYFRQIIEYGDEVLAKTPDMLPVLKQAGVVDSGGQGLMQVMKGAFDAFLGKEIDFTLEASKESTVKEGSASSVDQEIKYGYCTEFIILLNKTFNIKNEIDFKEYLESIGDSIVVVADGDVVMKQTGGVRCKGGVLVVFDVDDFKQINDRYGHIQGDRCLAGIAECIKKSYANFGYCYRIGGDEFCVLLKNGGNEGRCKQEFLQRLQEKRGEIAFLPTVSYGSAPFSGEDIVKVKDRADQDMYQYKKERKNRKRLS